MNTDPIAETPGSPPKNSPRKRTLMVGLLLLCVGLAAGRIATLYTTSQETHGGCCAGGGEETVIAGPVKYSCPMHPEVISDKKGNCPKCGMTLRAISAEPDKQKSDQAHAH